MGFFAFCFLLAWLFFFSLLGGESPKKATSPRLRFGY
jgi:hypothetical protein